MGRCPVRSIFPEALKLLEEKQDLLELVQSFSPSLATLITNPPDLCSTRLYRYPTLWRDMRSLTRC